MAHDLKISTSLASIQAEAAKVRFNTGYLQIYQGSKPASPDDPPTGSTLLATLRFGNPAAGSQVGGLITMNVLSPDGSAAASGSADWYRCLESDGTTPICDGTCGLVGGGYDCEMASTAISAGQEVSCASFTHQVRKG